MNSKISEKDKKTWNEFLSNDQKLPDKDNFRTETKVNKTRLLDLHGKTLDEANRVIENFIRKSYKEKVHKLIIVTGKGLHSKNEMDPYVSKDLGILKYSIPDFLKNNSELMKMISNISGASIADGGTGAFYIFLKKN
ncbi:Smr/MutS family protein [Candidatus Pelagibacter sp.]|uniref:Smr/MutS family protein n=1 Tax=Candidatus Pelagibacter sp. TaxID=2024849 RepID=UPI003F87AE92